MAQILFFDWNKGFDKRMSFVPDWRVALLVENCIAHVLLQILPLLQLIKIFLTFKQFN